MKQYLDLLKEIYEQGYEKGPARKGLPGTRELFCRTMTFDLQKGFPLLTCRKMYIKGFVHELLWLLRGETNISTLVKEGINIWNKDAYRFYKLRGGNLPEDTWLDFVKSGLYDFSTRMAFGDLGKVYGYQWRSFRGIYDQIEELIKGLKTNSNSRRHFVSAWNPVDYAPENGMAALPACHVMFQCNIREEFGNKYLDLMMLQRSCDMILGVPFDIAEYALLCHIIAAELKIKPGIFTWVGNSCHIYNTHLEAAAELLTRKDRLLPLCTLQIKSRKHFNEYLPDDFEFINYQALPPVKAELCAGE